jgi:hypothetical protein
MDGGSGYSGYNRGTVSERGQPTFPRLVDLKDTLLRTLPVLFALVGVFLSAQLRAQTPAKKQPASGAAFWTGKAGGVTYRWTDQDLTATIGTAGKPAFSVVQALKKEFGKPDADNGYSYYEVTFLPLSAVGSLLSYERDDYWDGGAHPSGWESFVTVDVHNPAQHLKLTDLFDAAQIRQALLSDPIVQHVLTREKIAPPPTLEELAKALSGKEFGGERDGMYSFPENLLSDFAFHHVENGKVAVRLLLPHGSEIFRFHHTQLGLLLPIPAARKSALLAAASGEAGSMMQAMQRVTRNNKVSVVLQERSPSK